MPKWGRKDLLANAGRTHNDGRGLDALPRTGTARGHADGWRGTRRWGAAALGGPPACEHRLPAAAIQAL